MLYASCVCLPGVLVLHLRFLHQVPAESSVRPWGVGSQGHSISSDSSTTYDRAQACCCTTVAALHSFDPGSGFTYMVARSEWQ